MISGVGGQVTEEEGLQSMMSEAREELESQKNEKRLEEPEREKISRLLARVLFVMIRVGKQSFFTMKKMMKTAFLMPVVVVVVIRRSLSVKKRTMVRSYEGGM